jgi:uncharacterized protein
MRDPIVQFAIDQITVKLKATWHHEPTGHDWEHIRRVKDMALHLYGFEGGDLDVIELLALLHDVSDHKFNGGKLNAGGEVARVWLSEFNLKQEFIDSVAEKIDQISFKGAKVESPVLAIEIQIVQDADRLDAIGAIGIARAFAFGGNKNRPIYDDSLPPVQHTSFEAYAKSKSHTINHFYEKLLTLKDKMNTQKAKEIGQERHQLMVKFLDAFHHDWQIVK